MSLAADPQTLDDRDECRAGQRPRSPSDGDAPQWKAAIPQSSAMLPKLQPMHHPSPHDRVAVPPTCSVHVERNRGCS